MIHLVIREPLAYQQTLCRALNEYFDRAFVAWFGEARKSDQSVADEFNARFLTDVGYRALFRALRSDPDPVVILGGWSSGMAYKTILMTMLLRVPLFIWTDHPKPRKRNWVFDALRKQYLRFLGGRISGFLACGRPTVEHMHELGIALEKITNFPCWVDVPEKWTLPKGCLEEPKRPLGLIAIGRHVPIKAFEVVIDAVALANQKSDAIVAELKLIGDGPELKELQARARGLGGDAIFTFSGWLPNDQVWQRINEADALVIPSIFEPYGVVVLEALASGRPVLASDRVIAALDRDDGCGAIFIHAAGDPAHLAGQIRLLAEDRNALRFASQAARGNAERWRPERAGAILKSLIDRTRPAARQDEAVRVYEAAVKGR